MTAYVPGPPELLPGRPDAIVDLQSDEGVALLRGQWRYADATVREVEFVGVGPDLGPGRTANRTYQVLPQAGGTDVEDQDWRSLAPAETRLRLGNGRVSFNWYRIAVTLPDRLGDLDPTGCTVVFECVVDDAAEIWVDGRLPVALGQSGGQVAAGFNAPNRVVLTSDARPGQRFQLAVFGINGPISAAPANYIWMRSATLDVYRPEHATVTERVDLRVARLDPWLDPILPAGTDAERVATGFPFTEGPVWTADGALLFSSPNTNTIYRWTPEGVVSVFRTKSGYAGVDIGRYTQPGSNGLAFDPDGRLTICQHGNRQVLRVEPHGNTTVLADSFNGRRLNSPNDLVYASDGTLYFTDPPFGLPDGDADMKKELPFSGVFAVTDGRIRIVTDELRGPNGVALSPDERHLYVGNWDPERKVVMRYDTGASAARGAGDLFCDLTGEPGEDAIDGLEVDRIGNVYVCGPGGIWILSPRGERLGLVGLPESPHNLTWGEADRQTLYVTAVTSVYRIRLAIGGNPSPDGKDDR